MSARTADINGFIEIAGNPLTRTGIFQYSGRNMKNAPDPNKIYNVYRPAEELADQACLDSFKMLPIYDDHPADLVGIAPGHMAAEDKSIEGTLGENAAFDSETGILSNNIKLYSRSIAQQIRSGKKQVSAGYRCLYDWTPGVHNGQQYDAVQRRIRGNHLALVNAGRSGPQVAVLDEMTFDHLDVTINDMKDHIMTAPTPEELNTKIEALGTKVQGAMDAMEKATKAFTDKLTADAAEDDAAKKKADDEAAAKKTDETKAMDAAINTAVEAATAPLKKEIEVLKSVKVLDHKDIFTQISERDKLASSLSHFTGTFDHSEMTLDSVAAYGIEKLGLKAEKGQERAVLSGFLHSRPIPGQRGGFAMDAKAGAAGESQIDQHFKPVKTA